MFYIKVCNNEPLTTSADVAQAFSTTNNSIVMAIDALRIPRTAAARHFFKEQRPLEGSDREITIYRMTKDGFTLLMESIDGRTTAAWRLQIENRPGSSCCCRTPRRICML
ncbi:TPA: Rha family transcriptional regulator [Escherichia coli]